MKPLLHALLCEPVTLGEVRELLLRHVMSDPSNYRNEFMTMELLKLYSVTHLRDTGKAPDNMVSPNQTLTMIRESFKKGFEEGYGGSHPTLMDFFKWPEALPKEHKIIREVLIYLGEALGLRVGQEVRKVREENPRPSSPN